MFGEVGEVGIEAKRALGPSGQKAKDMVRQDHLRGCASLLGIGPVLM